MSSTGTIRIGFVGAGNVATHLALGFDTAECVEVVQLFSRNIDHATTLASRLINCEPSDSLAELDTTLDALVIAVSDTSIADVVDAMPHYGGLLLHTSGSVPMNVLSAKAEHYGVLYPLQTFSRDVALELENVPFFIEAESDATRVRIDRLARLLSPRVYHANSEQRRTLHLAGVLSCNFVTYLWECATRVLSTDGYDFDVVAPLIEATIAKVKECGAHAAQTGPARRGDVATMQAHMAMLPEREREIYKLLSQAIMSSHDINKSI
jgi:predicted short-subunit dehydrogenase-like oxidoreductase (DUF2520 family)